MRMQSVAAEINRETMAHAKKDFQSGSGGTKACAVISEEARHPPPPADGGRLGGVAINVEEMIKIRLEMIEIYYFLYCARSLSFFDKDESLLNLRDTPF